MLAPEDIQQIVQAIFTTPEFQFLQSQMKQSAGAGGQMPGAQPDPSQQPLQPQPQLPVSQPSPQAGPSQGPPIGGDDDMDGDEGNPGAPGMANPKYSVQTDDSAELVERFSVLNDQYNEIVDRYAQLESVNKANMAQMARMQSAVVQLEQRAVDAERTEALKDLYQQYPHFIDLDEEKDTCLYSHGNDMGAEAFTKHVEKLEKMAKRASPTTRPLPGGEAPISEKDRYSADLAERVVDYYTEQANVGNYMTYEQAEAIVRKEMTGK